MCTHRKIQRFAAPNLCHLSWFQLSKTAHDLSNMASIYIVDVDKSPIYTRYFDISYIPSTVFFFNGQHMKVDYGWVNTSLFADWLVVLLWINVCCLCQISRPHQVRRQLQDQARLYGFDRGYIQRSHAWKDDCSKSYWSSEYSQIWSPLPWNLGLFSFFENFISYV